MTSDAITSKVAVDAVPSCLQVVPETRQGLACGKEGSLIVLRKSLLLIKDAFVKRVQAILMYNHLEVGPIS
jgi:hypothetical protein